MLLLELNITKNKHIDEKITELNFGTISNYNKEYKVEAI